MCNLHRSVKGLGVYGFEIDALRYMKSYWIRILVNRKGLPQDCYNA